MQVQVQVKCVLYSVQCAVCSVLPVTGEDLALQIRFFKYFTYKKSLEPKEYKPIMYLKFVHHAFWFLETFVGK
mgnify:FL=1